MPIPKVVSDDAVIEKVREAKKLYKLYGKTLLSEFKEELTKLDSAIEKTWKVMREFGLPEMCKKCAENGKCCCRPWVAEEFDEYDLLMNCLLGVDVPESREVEGLCFFVGKNGCRLKVRQVVCVDFLCPDVEKALGDEKVIELRKIEGEELEIAFKLKEKIKKRMGEIRD